MLQFLWTKKNYRHDDETNSKHGDVDENDEEVRSTKDGEDRPSSSGKNQLNILSFAKFNDQRLIPPGLDDEDATIHLSSETDPNLIWPTMQDLNTRLRRVITSYQRNYKKEELKQQQKAKVRIFLDISCSHSLITYFTLGEFTCNVILEMILIKFWLIISISKSDDSCAHIIGWLWLWFFNLHENPTIDFF